MVWHFGYNALSLLCGEGVGVWVWVGGGRYRIHHITIACKQGRFKLIFSLYIIKTFTMLDVSECTFFKLLKHLVLTFHRDISCKPALFLVNFYSVKTVHSVSHHFYNFLAEAVCYISDISGWCRLIWSMDAGRLSLTLCEDTVEEEEQNIITGIFKGTV